LSHVLRATGDLTAVQRLLGYSSPSVTEAVYIGEDTDLLTESVEKLDLAPLRRLRASIRRAHGGSG
jgi:site-specific recombinase XerC